MQVWRAGLRALVARRTRQKSALEIKRRKIDAYFIIPKDLVLFII
jgi:hypothetical protein